MTEHTALPLKLVALSDGTFIIDADGEIFNDDSFIVTACNCHAGLLANLIMAASTLRLAAASIDYPTLSARLWREAETIEQAIRKAKETQ